ncbi:hypothetical protein GCM10023196_029360 [Actinoallomurus vinaceus]|uniref:Probable replication restart protein PriA n=1 Tax=Actinoallomurus vinaceus TaxID=1080074 RepID=A0ABP8UAU8_9ACTN
MANDGGGAGPAPQIPGLDGLTERVTRAGDKASGRPAGKAARKGARRPAEALKVARVAVDVSLPHLDRPFDYLVSSDLDEKAVPGCRVRVRFAGQLVDGFLLERVEESDHDGRLSFLDRVISPEPVLTPEIAALAREVADRYAGTLADVLRLAVPPRHARAEADRRPVLAATRGRDAGEETATIVIEAGGTGRGTDAEQRAAAQAGGAEREAAAAETGGIASGPGQGAAEARAGGIEPGSEQGAAEAQVGGVKGEAAAAETGGIGSGSEQGAAEARVGGVEGEAAAAETGGIGSGSEQGAAEARVGGLEGEAALAEFGSVGSGSEREAAAVEAGGIGPGSEQGAAEGRAGGVEREAAAADAGGIGSGAEGTTAAPAGGPGPGGEETTAVRAGGVDRATEQRTAEEQARGAGPRVGSAAAGARSGRAGRAAPGTDADGTGRDRPGTEGEATGHERAGGESSGARRDQAGAEAGGAGGDGMAVESGGAGGDGTVVDGGDVGRDGSPVESGGLGLDADTEGGSGGSDQGADAEGGAGGIGPCTGAEQDPPGTLSDPGGPGSSGSKIDPGASSGSESGETGQEGTEAASGGADRKGGASVDPGPWDAYRAGPSFLTALTEGRAPRAVWTALPGTDWTAFAARAARAALDGGHGVLIVVADGREVARVDTALGAELGADHHVALTAELGPAERYRRWLTVLRGEVKVVVGTRAAMFAPVRDLGLVVLWDDGDDVHAEPHAPYPHAREVLALRAHRTGAGALIGGYTRTTDATQLVETGWAHPLVPDRDRLRRSMPYVRPAGDDAELARDEAARTARLPHLAFRTARQGLENGPVLVQVPRRGYVPALACARCRGPARCPECEGPLALTSGHAAPYCRWCGRIAGTWRCPECGSPHVRAVVVGARRTAEELGRSFPGVPVRTSGRDAVLASVGPEPALVVATPGAEPVPAEGYAAALLLDGWVLLGRADLRAGEEAMRRWTNAAALVRPGGPVVVLADGALVPVQALIRWDPVTFAERELAERRELGFPPAVRMASLTGSPQAIRELVEAAELPPDAEVLGPVEVGDGQERALVRVDRARGVALARSLKAAQAARSARKAADVVRVQIDPLELI